MYTHILDHRFVSYVRLCLVFLTSCKIQQRKLKCFRRYLSEAGTLALVRAERAIQGAGFRGRGASFPQSGRAALGVTGGSHAPGTLRNKGSACAKQADKIAHLSTWESLQRKRFPGKSRFHRQLWERRRPAPVPGAPEPPASPRRKHNRFSSEAFQSQRHLL